jgi:peptide-methionine (S)-S-oxide reductase
MDSILQSRKYNFMETATFGNGCFWCTEAVFQDLNGVVRVESGYSGGHVVNPTYRQVCEKDTGHAEVLRITYDPQKISYAELLEVFWKTHDPTTLNRQGNDVGPQYRSVIFYHNDEQKALAEQYRQQLEAAKIWDRPIVTAIEPLTNYYPAENYHQNYFKQHGHEPYCAYVIRPKVEKFKKEFKDKLKAESTAR